MAVKRAEGFKGRVEAGSLSFQFANYLGCIHTFS
jgi:hypothetical protein